MTKTCMIFDYMHTGLACHDAGQVFTATARGEFAPGGPVRRLSTDDWDADSKRAPMHACM